MLATGLLINIAILGYFKYYNFFIATVNPYFSILGPDVQMILPIGISFFTLTQIAYIVDAYLGKAGKYSFLEYGLFASFFPYLIAGPILDHKKIIPQFEQFKNFVISHENISTGIAFFVFGLFKKMVIADNLVSWVSPVFNAPAQASFFEAWAGALGYTFQLYFDFSGYCDMAIGIALILGITFPVNFNSPYKSASIIEFWRRWHITLSTFIRDYIYIPLGGNRKGEFRKIGNLLAAMLIAGIWHGAGWTFIIWGGLHGVYLSINHVWCKAGITIPRVIGWTITFVAVVVGWVIFRAKDISDACTLLLTMSGFRQVTVPITWQAYLSWLPLSSIQYSTMPLIPGETFEIAVLVALVIFVVALPNTQDVIRKYFRKDRIWFFILVIVFIICLGEMSKQQIFLYAQF